MATSNPLNKIFNSAKTSDMKGSDKKEFYLNVGFNATLINNEGIEEDTFISIGGFSIDDLKINKTNSKSEYWNQIQELRNEALDRLKNDLGSQLNQGESQYLPLTVEFRKANIEEATPTISTARKDEILSALFGTK
jgi:hypothetical protein